MLKAGIKRLAIPVSFLVTSFLFGCSQERFPPLTKNQKEMISAALSNSKYPQPKTIEVDEKTGFVVVTFEVSSTQIPDGGEAFATNALLKVREQLLPSGMYKNFRVTLNAPPEYTGIVTRYGSARFTEEREEVIWKQKG